MDQLTPLSPLFQSKQIPNDMQRILLLYLGKFNLLKRQPAIINGIDGTWQYINLSYGYYLPTNRLLMKGICSLQRQTFPRPFNFSFTPTRG